MSKYLSGRLLLSGFRQLLCLFFLFFLSPNLFAASAARGMPLHFDLIGEKGRVTQESYPGKYLLLAIGYTNCPDICPTTLYEYSEVMRAIKNPDAIQPLFVTIDPVSDDMKYLKIYTHHFHERIEGLSGEMENLRALTDQLGATFGYRLNGKKVDKPTPGTDYNVYHSGFIYLISPERKLIDIYDYQIGPAELTKALDKVLGEPGGQTAKSAADGGAPGASAKNEAAASVPPGRFAQAAQNAQTTRPAAAACTLPVGFSAAKSNTALSDILPEMKTGAGAEKQGGTLVLLNVWAAWCAPCRIELPALDKLAAAHKDISVQTLNLGDKPADIAALFSKMNIRTLPQTGSNDAGLLARLGAVGLPFTALFVDGRQIASRNGLLERMESIADFARCRAAAR